MDHGLARPVRSLLAVSLAAVACLAGSPDADAAKSTKLRVPDEGNLTVARLELRATAAALRRPGPLPIPRLRSRRGNRLPRDVGVFASVERRARRGRFSAFVVIVNPAQRRRASGLRAFSSQDLFDKFFEIVGDFPLPRRDIFDIEFDVNVPTNKSFPNVLNANSPRAERLADRLLDEKAGPCRPVRRPASSLGPCRIHYFGAIAAAKDEPMDARTYAALRRVGAIGREDVQNFRLPPGPGEDSRGLVSFLYSQPILGLRIESAPGQRIVTLDGASQGFQCLIINPTTGECRFVDNPAAGGSFLIGLNRGGASPPALIELFPELPPAQFVDPPGDDTAQVM